jgi:hypothetical protein
MSVAGSTNKYTQLDNKIADVEFKLFENLEKMESKYNTLKDQMVAFAKLYEDEKAQKDAVRLKNLEDLKNFETKVKSLLNDEREVGLAFLN